MPYDTVTWLFHFVSGCLLFLFFDTVSPRCSQGSVLKCTNAVLYLGRLKKKKVLPPCILLVLCRFGCLFIFWSIQLHFSLSFCKIPFTLLKLVCFLLACLFAFFYVLLFRVLVFLMGGDCWWRCCNCCRYCFLCLALLRVNCLGCVCCMYMEVCHGAQVLCQLSFLEEISEPQLRDR